MKKYFIVTDVHSFFDEMLDSLNEKGYDKNNPDHIFVSLGDLLDRGTQARECLEFVNSIPKENKILILGNHELLLLDVLKAGRYYPTDISNGTVDTINQIAQDFNTEIAINKVKQNEDWEKYIESCQFYAEVGDNIFVHGWIPGSEFSKYGQVLAYKYDKNWRDAKYKDWVNATWINGMEAWSEGIREKGKTIFCGHWHTSWGHSNLHNYGVEFLKVIETYWYDENGKMHPFECFDPFIDEGIVALDACTARTRKVNCYTLEV